MGKYARLTGTVKTGGPLDIVMLGPGKAGIFLLPSSLLVFPATSYQDVASRTRRFRHHGSANRKFHNQPKIRQ